MSVCGMGETASFASHQGFTDLEGSLSSNGVHNVVELQGILSIVFHLTYFALNLHLEVVSLPQHCGCS